MKKFTKINEKVQFDDDINVDINVYVDKRSANYILDEVLKLGIGERIIEHYGKEKVISKLIEASFREHISYSSGGLAQYMEEYLELSDDITREDILDELGLNVDTDYIFKKINDIND